MRVLLFISLLFFTFTYDREAAVTYAHKYAKTPNHKCGKYLDCSPCSYFGREACGYESHGGDCANFVSQCLVLGGGHEKLNGGSPCRGYPCGFEEPGAKKLGACLQKKGWTSTCGYHQPLLLIFKRGMFSYIIQMDAELEILTPFLLR